MAYWIYNILLSLFFAISLPFVPILLLFGKRFRKGILQRMAVYPREICEPLKGSRPIWIHAVSVGEVLSARHLFQELKERFPQRKILISTFTATGNEIAMQTGTGDAVIFLPLDHPWIVQRSLALFDPALLIFLETEIWPNFLRSAFRKGIPALLLSGRLSPRAFRRYSCFRLFFSMVVRQFTAVGMQSEEDAKRMIGLGFSPGKIWITGSLKHASPEESAGESHNGEGVELLCREKEARKVLVAGSTHRGEEEVLLEVFLHLKTSFPNLMMVLAPRHPQRFDEVERLLKKKQVQYEKKSLMNGGGGVPSEVVFLDTLGDLPAFYSIADIAFVGGSLVNAGGHNLMEPARYHKPVLFGPHMTNFADIANEIKQQGGGIEVRGKEDLIREISVLLSDRARAESMGELAYSVVQGDRGVIDRTIALVTRYLHP